MASELNHVMTQERIADLNRAAERARLIAQARRAQATARRSHRLDRAVIQGWLRDLAPRGRVQAALARPQPAERRGEAR